MDYAGAIIWSGEGETGTFERHTGRSTLRAINRRLTRERCNDDRWALALVPAGPQYAEDTYIQIDGVGNPQHARTVPTDEIR